MVAIRSQLAFYEKGIRQKRQPRPRFNPAFRLLWVLLSRAWTGWKSAAELMKPKTVLKWHENAFFQWWRWKSRRKGGRPTISQEIRALIRRLSRENVLWSAETIHGHLLLVGFDPPCPDTIRKYMVKPRGGRDKSQTWLTFLRNHLQVSWAMDFFTVLNHSRRQVVHFAVTAHPTMAWVIQQLREAMPFGQQPTYLFRDNDGVYGDEVGRFLAGTGIAEVKTVFGQKTRPGAPEQELFAQRPLKIKQAREVFCQGRFPASLIYAITAVRLTPSFRTWQSLL